MKRKRNYLIPVTLFIIILIIGLVTGFIVGRNAKYSIKLDEIEEADVKYYVLEKNDKYGVINKEGTVVIEPQYDGIKIPNPTKDTFICLVNSENDTWKAVDSSNNQKWTSYNNVDAISIKAITSLVPYEKNVLKYQEGNLYGLIDFEGNKITDAIYEDISSVDYKEGYLKVKEQEKYGVINIKGTSIIDTVYDDITSDGYYSEEKKYEDAGFILRIKTDDGYKYGYAKTNGKIMLDTVYNEISRITEIENSKDVYFITSLNGKYGLMKNSDEVIENDFRSISFDRTNTLLTVQKNTSFGVYDLDGNCVIPIDYDDIIVGGEYINAFKGENTVIFDKNGNTVNTTNSSKEKVSDNYSIIIDNNNNYNIVDKSDNVLLKDEYSYLEYFKDDLFIATNDSKTGLIKANGEIVVPLQYNTIQNVDGANCLQATLMDTNKTLVINSQGKVQEGLENASFIKEEKYVKILSSSDVKYYTLDGNETTYKELFPENALYAVKQNDKWGFKNSEGKIVVNCEYDFVSEQKGNYAGIKKDGKWGIIDITGKIIKEPTYEISFNDVNFLGEYYEIGTNVGLPIYCGDENI